MATQQIRHGTLTGYATDKCRCDDCRAASRSYQQARRTGSSFDPETTKLFSDLLHELFPDGLTDDCPVRRAQRATTH